MKKNLIQVLYLPNRNVQKTLLLIKILLNNIPLFLVIKYTDFVPEILLNHFHNTVQSMSEIKALNKKIMHINFPQNIPEE